MSIYIQLIIASFLWGSNVIVMKLLLNEIPFLFLATLRVFFSLFFLSLYMKCKNISFLYPYKMKALIIGIIAIYLNFFFTFLGMNQVKGIENAFMNALAPTFTFVFSFILLKKRGSLNEYIAIILTVLGFLFSIHFRIFSIRIGLIYLLLGMILYMLSQVLIQKWHIESSLTFVFYELLFGFVFLFIHCLIKNQYRWEDLLNMKMSYWISFFVISGIGFAYIQVIYLKAIEKIGAFQTSFYLSLNPLFTYLESFLFLNEKFDILHFIGFIMLGFAIYFMNKNQIKKLLQHHDNS